MSKNKTYLKRTFSDVNDGATRVFAEDLTPNDIQSVINQAASEVEESTGSRAFAELFAQNYEARLFAEAAEAEANGGGK